MRGCAHIDDARRSPDHASDRGFFISRLSGFVRTRGGTRACKKKTPPSLLAEFRLNNDHSRSGRSRGALSPSLTSVPIVYILLDLASDRCVRVPL